MLARLFRRVFYAVRKSLLDVGHIISTKCLSFAVVYPCFLLCIYDSTYDVSADVLHNDLYAQTLRLLHPRYFLSERAGKDVFAGFCIPVML